LRARVIPSARRRAGELGVDLAKVRGSGPEGVITLGDIEAAAEPRPRESYAPLRGPRRAMAEAMAGAGREVVPATVTDVADVGAWIGDGDVTVRLVRAIAKAASAEPSLNAWFDGNSLARRLHGQLDLGIATDTVDGLFVPVLRDAGRASPEAIRAGIDRLRAAVTDRTISREDLTGATFTLSNFGMIGGRHASLVVMPPQVAIVGAGRIFAPDGRGKAWLLPLSVSFDHRAVTGGEAARFLARALEDLELCE
jgi:pyruvate dehydrogenase E2 component (dihydrolipoamide acetyltransferase)